MPKSFFSVLVVAFSAECPRLIVFDCHRRRRFLQRRRPLQRERQKSNRFGQQNNYSVCTGHFVFEHFFAGTARVIRREIPSSDVCTVPCRIFLQELLILILAQSILTCVSSPWLRCHHRTQ